MPLNGKGYNYSSKNFIFFLPAVNFFVFVILSYCINYPSKLNYGIPVTSLNEVSLFRQMQNGFTILNFLVAFVFLLLSVIFYTTTNKTILVAILFVLAGSYFSGFFLVKKNIVYHK